MLHITIVPWFRLDMPSRELAKVLEDNISDIEPFEVVMGREAKFGYREGRIATLVKEPTPFHKIEERVRGVLKSKKAWLVDETTKVRRPYRPHVTMQKSGQLHIGDEFMCNSIFIVGQRGHSKEIKSKISLA
jgi:2'-5' RNA ligase